MKSNFKLEFKDARSMLYFAVALTNLLSERGQWRRECSFFSRKNIMYVVTHNYSWINNFIKNGWNKNQYNYKVILEKRD